jgi:thiol-disulfide isomerase/thioredoxin
MNQVSNMLKNSLILLVLFLFTMRAAAEEKPVMLFFYSVNCEHCQSIKKNFLPDFLKKYNKNFRFVELEVSTPANFDSLNAMESRLNFPEDRKDYPAVYFMGNMIEGEIAVGTKLESLVKTYLANPDSMKELDYRVMQRTPVSFQKGKIKEANPVYLAYFYKTGCKKCSRANEIITWLEKTYPYSRIDRFDIADKKSKLISTALGTHSKVPHNRLMSTPMFFIGRTYVLSEDISREKIAGLVSEYAKTGAEPSWRSLSQEELDNSYRIIENKFNSFSIMAITFAGLFDGINPCAFATILFFVSYLTMLGRKRNEILLVGLSFSFAVFLTYFLVGLGFFKIIKSFSNIELLSKIIFGGTAVLCLIFGVLSIYDYFKARLGKTSEMTLQLPVFLKKRIHSTIREKARTESIVAGAVVAGFLVSILEFACTGQVYLPTITLMVGMGGINVSAVFYLFLYNILFITPLIVVFGIVYFGVSSQIIARFMESRVGSVKLALSAVFFSVSGLLFWAVFV